MKKIGWIACAVLAWFLLFAPGMKSQVQHGITVGWTESVTVQGFNVYGSLVTGGPYTKLNGSLISATATSYFDPESDGKVHYYVITAVGLASQGSIESAYSTQITATSFLVPPAPVPTGATPQ